MDVEERLVSQRNHQLIFKRMKDKNCSSKQAPDHSAYRHGKKGRQTRAFAQPVELDTSAMSIVHT